MMRTTFWLLWTITALVTPTAVANSAPKLVYGITTPPQKENSNKAGYDTMPNIMKELFHESGFNMVPREVPTGLRLQAEVGRGNVDIFLGFVNASVRTIYYPEDTYQFYRTRLGAMPVLYWQRSGDHWKDLTSKDWAVQPIGIARMPVQAAEAMTGLKFPWAMNFGNHTSMVKGLLIERVNIILGSPRATNSALEELDSIGKIEPLDIAFEVDLYVMFRTNLADDTKSKIVSHLDKAVPRFIQNERFRHYFPSP